MAGGLRVGGVRFDIGVDLKTGDLKKVGTLAKALRDCKQSAGQQAQAGFRRVEVAVKRFGASSGVSAEKVKKLENKVKTLTAANKRLATRQRVVAKTQADMARRTQLAADAFRALGAGIATVKLAQLIREATWLAGRTQVLGTVMQNVGRNANYTAGELRSYENQIVKLGITQRHARQSIIQAARAHIDLDKAVTLARISQDAAVISGENSSEAYQEILRGIQQLTPRLLRFRGIVVTLPTAYRRWAAATGQNINAMSEADKQQALLNLVLQEGQRIQGTYIAAMQDVAKQHTSLARHIEAARVKLGQQFIPLWEDMVSIVGSAAQTYSKASPAVHTTTGALAASAVVAGGLATTYFTLNTAVAAYTALQGAALAAEKARLISVKGLTAAQAELAAAQTAAAGSMAARIIPAAALAAGAFVGIRAWERHREEAYKAREAEAAATASRIVNLRAAIEHVQRLAKASDGSTASQEKLRAAMSSLVDLTGEYRNELSLLADAHELVAAVQERIPESAQPFEAYLENLRQKAIAANKAFEQVQQGKDARPWYRQAPFYSPSNLEMSAEYQQAQENAMLATAAYSAAVEADNSRRLRELDSQLSQLERADQAAQKVAEKLGKERAKTFKSAGLEILDEFTQYLDQLEAAFVSEKEIIDRADRALKSELAEIDKRYAPLLSSATGAKRARLEAERDAAKLAAERSISDEKERQLAQYARIVDAQQQAVELAEKKLDVERRETANLVERVQRERAGENAEIIKLEQEIRDAETAYRAAQEEFAAKSFESEEARQTALEARRVAEQRYAAEQEERYHKLAKLRQQEIRDRREAVDEHKAAVAEHIDAERQLVEEITKLEGTWTDNTARAAQARIDARKAEFDAIEGFIRRTQGELLEARLPGAREITGTVERFGAMVARAQTAEQLDKLKALLPQRLAMVGMQVVKAAQRGQISIQQAMQLHQLGLRGVEEINQAIEQRRKALEGVKQQQQADVGIIKNAIQAKRQELAVERELLATARLRTEEAREQLRLSQAMGAADPNAPLRGGPAGQAGPAGAAAPAAEDPVLAAKRKADEFVRAWEREQARDPAAEKRAAHHAREAARRRGELSKLGEIRRKRQEAYQAQREQRRKMFERFGRRARWMHTGILPPPAPAPPADQAAGQAAVAAGQAGQQAAQAAEGQGQQLQRGFTLIGNAFQRIKKRGDVTAAELRALGQRITEDATAADDQLA